MSMENMQSFINRLKDEDKAIKDKHDIDNSEQMKRRKLECCKKDYILGMMCDILSRLYNKSLPLDDSYCDTNGELNKDYMREFINKRGGLQYITDACKKSPILNKAMVAVEDACKKKFAEKEIKLADVDPADLDYHFDADEEKGILDKIESDGNFDEISEVIKQNVENDAVRELEKSKKEEEENEDLEKKLEDQEEVDSEAAFESALAYAYANKPRIYQPSLFEAILQSRIQPYGESVTARDIDYAFVESVMEYTALNVVKALKMESFDVTSTRALAQKYLA